MPNEPQSTQIWNGIWLVLTSGLFFMVVGCIFLIVAARTMGNVHAAFSFVLVVLGSAIFLFGTGTQGMGEFTSPDAAGTAAKYKVGIAGGAGVLALAIGFGIVKESSKIRDVFQIEQRYARVQLKHQSDGISTFRNYVAEAHMEDGTPIPALRRGDDVVEVLVPYFENQLPSKLYVIVNLTKVDQGDQNAALASAIKDTLSINISTQSLHDTTGSLIFPLYTPDTGSDTANMTLNMQASAVAQLNDVDAHQSEGRNPSNPIPAPIIEAQ